MYLMYEGVYRDYGPGGELLSEATRAQPDSTFPMTLWLDPQGPHAVHNLDSRGAEAVARRTCAVAAGRLGAPVSVEPHPMSHDLQVIDGACSRRDHDEGGGPADGAPWSSS
jgi:hypothetical protein